MEVPTHPESWKSSLHKLNAHPYLAQTRRFDKYMVAIAIGIGTNLPAYVGGLKA